MAWKEQKEDSISSLENKERRINPSVKRQYNRKKCAMNGNQEKDPSERRSRQVLL
jgi:hypothetical protein